MNTFPDYEKLQQLLKGELPRAEAFLVCESIRNHQPVDNFSSGIKAFLEQNNYAPEALIVWRNKARSRLLKKTTEQPAISFSQIQRIAALLLIALLLGGFYYFSNPRSSGWADFYTVDPGLPVFMHTSADLKWNQLFRENKYQEALMLISKELKAKPLNDTLQYYRLVCMFETGKLNSDVAWEIPASGLYADKSTMLLAFNEWKQGNESSAMKRFNILTQSRYKQVREKAVAIISAHAKPE
jgi:hypothetical protein